MTRIFLILIGFFCISILPVSAHAQDDADFNARVEVAKKLQEIKPVGKQIDAALEVIARQYPEDQREPFLTAMKRLINYNAIEKISLDAMVDTYSLKELQRMYDFYSSPEAASIAEKTPKYEEKVRPEISRMIDKTLMRVRTGGN